MLKHIIEVDYYYSGNNNRYRINIILCLYKKLGLNLSNCIYYYCKYYNNNKKNENIIFYNDTFSIISPVRFSWHYYIKYLTNIEIKNKLFFDKKDYNKLYTVVNNKQKTCRLIHMINDKYFICKTETCLKYTTGNLSKYLHDDGNHYKYNNDINLLSNITRLEIINIFDKIKIIKRIAKIHDNILLNKNWWGHEYDSSIYYNLYNNMNNNFISFQQREDVCEPGYIVDKNNIIYGH